MRAVGVCSNPTPPKSDCDGVTYGVYNGVPQSAWAAALKPPRDSAIIELRVVSFMARQSVVRADG
ncbi:hypothetical protein D3C75_1296420 [compost metagenome]